MYVCKKLLLCLKEKSSAIPRQRRGQNTQLSGARGHDVTLFRRQCTLSAPIGRVLYLINVQYSLHGLVIDTLGEWIYFYCQKSVVQPTWLHLKLVLLCKTNRTTRSTFHQSKNIWQEYAHMDHIPNKSAFLLPPSVPKCKRMPNKVLNKAWSSLFISSWL